MAERVRKDLEWAVSGPVARVDVTMSCSKNVIPGPTSGQTGMGARHFGRCQRQDREAFPHSHQASFFPQLLSSFPASGISGSRTDPQYPHASSCGFAVGAKARERSP